MLNIITENFSLENSYFSYWFKTLDATKMFFHHYKNKLIFHSASEPCRVIPFPFNLSFSLPGKCELHPCCPRSQLFLPSLRISHSVCLKIKTEKKEEKPISKHYRNQYQKEEFLFSFLDIINIYPLCQ